MTAMVLIMDASSGIRLAGDNPAWPRRGPGKRLESHQLPAIPNGLNDLSHNARDAARLPLRAGDVMLEIAHGGRSEIARPQIGPGPAALLAFAGGLAGLAGRIGRQLEIAGVAADPVDGKFDRTGVRLDHAGA